MHFYMHSYLHKNFIIVKSGCYKPTPLRRISPRDSGKVGLGVWVDKIRIDGIIEEMIEVTLYESKILDNQG
jgi:hypothetical protein